LYESELQNRPKTFLLTSSLNSKNHSSKKSQLIVGQDKICRIANVRPLQYPKNFKCRTEPPKVA
ncbi:MAG: hypothetical protein QM642_09595, partial [Edaphocola sp.]